MEGITSPKDDGNYSSKINNSRISAPKVLAYFRQSLFLPYQSDWICFILSAKQIRAQCKGLYAYGEGYVPDYTVFNFKSSYEINHNWKVSLGIENVFNKLYQPQLPGGQQETLITLMLWDERT
jgi:iron complex outermembrane receptor protein